MDATTLATFLAVDLLFVLTPGADWAYAITAGLRERSIVPAVAGLIAGHLAYALLAVAGLVVMVGRSPALLAALTLAGAAYLMWLGCGLLRQPATVARAGGALASSRGRIALNGAVTSALNPKVLLLYFALFPQFLDSAGWPVAVQTGLLGALHVTACAVVYLAVGLLTRTLLKTRPSAARVVTRISGTVMIAVGGFLLAEQLTG